MKVIKVPNLLTTDQKVGGSSPSKRTEGLGNYKPERFSLVLEFLGRVPISHIRWRLGQRDRNEP